MIAVAFVWKVGGRREKIAMGAVALAWVAMLVVQRLAGRVDPWSALVTLDGFVFFVLMALSWRDSAGWTIHAVGVQGVAMGVHVIRALTPAMPTWTYLTSLAVASYALLGVICAGAWLRRKHNARGGLQS